MSDTVHHEVDVKGIQNKQAHVPRKIIATRAGRTPERRVAELRSGVGVGKRDLSSINIRLVVFRLRSYHLASPRMLSWTGATEISKDEFRRIDLREKHVVGLDVEEHVSLIMNMLYTR